MTESTARVEIASVAAGGDGVGRTNGMVVFVPRTAPGDVALVRVAAGKRFARGHLESLEIASPHRVQPACHHYTVDRCGGCQLQHLAYDAQLAAKGVIIGDALRRIEPSLEQARSEVSHSKMSTQHSRGATGGHRGSDKGSAGR